MSDPGLAAAVGALPGNLTVTTSSGISTPTDFAKALLSRLGAPDTPQNEQALVAWAAAEGGHWNNTAAYNPFNTTLTMPGSTVMAGGNSAGVQSFTSWQQGLDATVQTLQGYPQVLAALRAGNNAKAITDAVVNSPWGTKTINLSSAAGYASQSQSTATASNVSTSVSGPGSVPPYNPTQPYPITPEVQRWVNQNAGQDAWMLTMPGPEGDELRNIFGWAGAKNVTDVAEVVSLVAQSNWAKSHSDAQQAWQQKQASQPTEAAHEIAIAKSSITTQAGTMGVTLTDQQLSDLALNTNLYGWTSDELTKAIAAYLPTTGETTAGGAAQVNFAQLKQDAIQTWGVPTTDEQIAQWVQQIAMGTQTVAGVQATMKQRAMGLYPTLADQFTRGETFKTATDPYRAIASSYLSIPAESVNFTDPKWMAAINQVDPKTGARTEMGLDQWTNYIRSQPQYGYQNTTLGKNEMVGLANSAAKTLGVIAP